MGHALETRNPEWTCSINREILSACMALAITNTLMHRHAVEFHLKQRKGGHHIDFIAKAWFWKLSPRGSLRARGWRIWCLCPHYLIVGAQWMTEIYFELCMGILWTEDNASWGLRWQAIFLDLIHVCISTHIIVFHLSVFAVEEIKLMFQGSVLMHTWGYWFL